MTHILKSKNLEIHIDSPLKNYNLSRFDWTGKITGVKFKNVDVTGVERIDLKKENVIGKGLYNEFGMETAIGYDEINKGEWFPKIGIGLLKKDDKIYDFVKNYDIQPAIFKVKKKSNKIITIDCKSQIINGFGYELKKEIKLFDNGFEIKYFFKNTGNKTISTSEYIHNFLAINMDFIGPNYILTFPFQIKPKLFKKTFNPENKVEISQREITFNNTPNEQFFFSNLSGSEEVEAGWELINTKSNIGISEKGNFKTTKVNLWGSKHVVSPELFFDVNVLPGQFVEWIRTYNVFDIN